MQYMRWIPVDERAPDKELEEYRGLYGEWADIELIVFIRNAQVSTMLAYDGTGFFIPDDEDRDYYDVTHWMHMPPRPDECLINIDLGDQIETNFELLEAILT